MEITKIIIVLNLFLRPGCRYCRSILLFKSPGIEYLDIGLAIYATIEWSHISLTRSNFYCFSRRRHFCGEFSILYAVYFARGYNTAWANSPRVSGRGLKSKSYLGEFGFRCCNTREGQKLCLPWRSRLLADKNRGSHQRRTDELRIQFLTTNILISRVSISLFLIREREWNLSR